MASKELELIPLQEPRQVGKIQALITRRKQWVVAHRESGMATAEYAIAMIAAAGFAGLLIVILKSGPVRELLTSIIQTALGTR